MSQKYSTLTVALNDHYSEEELAPLLNAIRALKMVADATPKDVGDRWSAEVNAKLAIKEKLIKLMGEL